MLTSKQLIERAGISRATLNNYVARGLLPKPVVTSPAVRGGRHPRQIGYFPDGSLERVAEILRMKAGGMSMDEITSKLVGVQVTADAVQEPASPGTGTMARVIEHPAAAERKQPLVLTMDQVPYPAYMVNYRFEVVWFNEKAHDVLNGVLHHLAPRTEQRSIFHLLLTSEDGAIRPNRDELLRLNLALAKERMTLDALVQHLQPLGASKTHLLERLYTDTMPVSGGPIVEAPLRLKEAKGNRVDDYCAYAAYFREGILLIFAPRRDNADSLLHLLARRDSVIRNLLSKRLPTLTDLAVLVTDLQDSVKICSELPPEEYFELINEIWSETGAVFRKYYGTHGKHVGDGMVYYFFPQPDCNYIMNAAVCAQEIKAVMARISKAWQLRKKWTTELYLNTGLNEGQEWLGTFQTATTVEFAVLGDTINHTARLSDFARHGSTWATKNFIGKMTSADRARVKFGIQRQGAEGQTIFVESTYSRLANLVDLASGRYEKLSDIGGLPVTEIIDVRAA